MFDHNVRVREIGVLDAAGARTRAEELADLLNDAVNSGAAVGFAAPLEPDRAVTYWRRVAENIEAGQSVLLVAGEPLVGTVQLHFAAYPNGRHRRAGAIPDRAYTPDGTLSPSTFFFKRVV